MTPAEKSALALEHTTPFVDEDYAVFSQSAALIRRLAAALKEYTEAVDGAPKLAKHLSERHADALRDVREEA